MKNMNIYFGVLLSLFLLLSCKKDKENISITGTWKPVEFAQMCESVVGYSSTYSPCEQQSHLTFTTDGDFKELNFNWVSPDCYEHASVSGTWTLDVNTLTLLYSKGSMPKYKVSKPTKDILRLTYKMYQSDDSPCDGVYKFSHYYIDYHRVTE